MGCINNRVQSKRQPDLKAGPNSLSKVQYSIVRSIQWSGGNIHTNYWSMGDKPRKEPPCIITISLETNRNLTKAYYPNH